MFFYEKKQLLLHPLEAKGIWSIQRGSAPWIGAQNHLGLAKSHDWLKFMHPKTSANMKNQLFFGSNISKITSCFAIKLWSKESVGQDEMTPPLAMLLGRRGETFLSKLWRFFQNPQTSSKVSPKKSFLIVVCIWSNKQKVNKQQTTVG